MITIFTMAWNEELLLQFMIDHYRQRFPDCRIVVYDNQSTDNTKNIALANKCDVVEYNTGGEVDDEKLRTHKNTCWKSSLTDWVLVCDVDELLDITQNDLINEAARGTSIVKCEAYNMINHEDNFDLHGMVHGVREQMYDKYYLFNKKLISDINYVHGAHIAYPHGKIVFSDKLYKLYHYKYINLQRLINRSKMTSARHSAINKKNNWGWHNNQPEQQITEYWNHVKSNSIKIR